MIRIGICEDIYEELYIQEQLVKKIMFKQSKNIKLYRFQSGEDLLFEIETTGNMDIILLDIELMGISGIETARRIRQKDTRAVLIFISCHDQYCKEIIEVQPFAFIDKPLREEQLEKILKHALETKLDFSESYRFSYHKMQYKIPLGKIRLFQSDRRIIRVDTVYEDSKTEEFQFYGKLEEVEMTVNESAVKFIRIRKSFLVNKQFIIRYSAGEIILDNGMVLEIGKNYKEAVKRHYLLNLEKEKRGYEEKDILKKQCMYYARQDRVNKEWWEQFRRIRHNMCQHYILEKTYLENKEYDMLEEYCDKNLNFLRKKDHASHTGNMYIDSIVNYKAAAAEKEGIEFITNIRLPIDAEINADDFTICLGNLIDNAVEAVRKLENDKYVIICISADEDNLFINIKNKYLTGVNKSGDRYLTAKSDKEDHGIGLQIVQQIVEKYNGEMLIQDEGGEFSVSILMYNFIK